MTVTVQTCFWKGYVKKKHSRFYLKPAKHPNFVYNFISNEQNKSPVRFVATIFSPPHRRFHGGVSSQGLHQELCVYIYIYIYTNTYKHLVYIICIYHNVQLFAFKHNEWYNISGFHSKACGFHSLIASNLYRRNIDASWCIISFMLNKMRTNPSHPFTAFTKPWQEKAIMTIANNPVLISDHKPSAWLPKSYINGVEASENPGVLPIFSAIRWYQPSSSLSSCFGKKKNLFHQNSSTVKSSVAPKG